MSRATAASPTLWRATRLRAGLVAAVTIFTLVPAFAAGAAGLEPPSPELTVTGQAAVYHEDVAGARERAVAGALTRALEQYAGLRIEASTLIDRGELIRREVKAHTHGYVRSFEVLEERRTGDQLTVKVRVAVAEAPVEASFRQAVSATTTLLLVRESNLGAPVEGQVVPAVMAEPFFTASLKSPPEDTVTSAAGKVGEGFWQRPDPDTARELGLRYLAGMIVVAWADTRLLDSGPESIGYRVDASVLRPVAAAAGNVTVLSGRTGEVIAARRFEDVRGSDASDARRAGLNALHALGGQMKAFIVDALSRYVSTLGFELRVAVEGPQAADGAPRVRRVLESTRWVESVEIAAEAPAGTELRVMCRERPIYVLEELRQAPELKVVRFNAAAAEVSVR